MVGGLGQSELKIIFKLNDRLMGEMGLQFFWPGKFGPKPWTA